MEQPFGSFAPLLTFLRNALSNEAWSISRHIDCILHHKCAVGVLHWPLGDSIWSWSRSGNIHARLHSCAFSSTNIAQMGCYSSLKASFILGTVLNLILILGHEISEYQPTRSIVIPDHYDGCVHLFVVNGPRDNVYVDDRGFGYIGSEGKVNWEIRRGGKNITNAWNTSPGNEICYDDGPQLICYDVLCLEIGPEDHYPEEHIDPYGMVKCMNHYEFLDLVRLGWIDESQLRKRVWDADRSRLNQAESRLGDL